LSNARRQHAAVFAPAYRRASRRKIVDDDLGLNTATPSRISLCQPYRQSQQHRNTTLTPPALRRRIAFDVTASTLIDTARHHTPSLFATMLSPAPLLMSTTLSRKQYYFTILMFRMLSTTPEYLILREIDYARYLHFAYASGRHITVRR
jgi:hypothetical protein